MTTDPISSEPRTQWWLASGGQPEGPYGAEHVRDSLRTGTIRATALACPVGGAEWKPVAAWPEFRRAADTDETARLTPSLHDSPITNSRLPGFANAICVYAIAASPVIWILQNLCCCVGGVPYKEDSNALGAYVLSKAFFALLSLLATVVLAIGGVRLRAARRSGRMFLLSGIWMSLAFGVLHALSTIGLSVLANPEDSLEATATENLIGLASAAIGLTEVAFLIVSLVWLHSSGRQLPLSSN